MKLRRYFIVVLLGSALSCSQQTDPLQENSAFSKAIKDQSSSPYFIKIQVLDSTANRRFTTCVTSNLFQGALHIEQSLPYGDGGTSAVERFAISNQKNVFTFGSPAALQNMPWPPTAAELSEARDLAANLSGEALISSAEGGELRDYYTGSLRYRERMAAVACALIDRGLAPRLADMTGSLYVERAA